MWILNEEVHVTEDGELIPTKESPFIWIGGMVGNRKISNVAPTGDAALVPLLALPQQALDDTLMLLKRAVSNNFIAAFFLVASAGMALHYEAVIERYEMCPTPMLIDNCFNAGARTTARETTKSRSTALITLNWDIMKSLCSKSTYTIGLHCIIIAYLEKAAEWCLYPLMIQVTELRA